MNTQRVWIVYSDKNEPLMMLLTPIFSEQTVKTWAELNFLNAWFREEIVEIVGTGTDAEGKPIATVRWPEGRPGSCELEQWADIPVP